MIAVSACLLGLNCRYDGGDKRDEELLKNIDCSKIVPFCPEVNILGAPRESIDLFETKYGIKAIGSKTFKDYTSLLENEAKRFFEANPDVKIFYLKSKSPSCALSSAKVYDEDCNLLSQTSTGVFTKKLKIWYKRAKFIER